MIKGCWSVKLNLKKSIDPLNYVIEKLMDERPEKMISGLKYFEIKYLFHKLFSNFMPTFIIILVLKNFPIK